MKPVENIPVKGSLQPCKVRVFRA